MRIEYVTDAGFVQVRGAWVTFAAAVAARVDPDCALMTASTMVPSCSKATRCEVGVLALKNVAQFFLIAATAAEPVAGSPLAAGVEDCEVGEVLGGAEVVLPELPPLPPHAVNAIPVAASILTARREDPRQSRRCIATVCRTKGVNGNHDVADSPEFFRGRTTRSTGRSPLRVLPGQGAVRAV